MGEVRMGNGGAAVVTAKRPHENRWSARKNADAVARLLRGESLDELSRDLRVKAHRLQAWRDEFVASAPPRALHQQEMPVTACDLPCERVLAFYEALGVPLGAVLTDDGREFCGRPDAHPCELLLALESMDHRWTKIGSPRTDGFVERMNRTLLERVLPDLNVHTSCPNAGLRRANLSISFGVECSPRF
jgi:hypothetical protein